MHLLSDLTPPAPRAPALATLTALLRTLADPTHVVDLTAPVVAPSDASAAEVEAYAALDAFVGRMRDVLFEICRASNDASRAAAENAFLLRQIAEVTGQQSDETAEMATAVHQTAQAAAVVAESSDATRRLTDELQRVSHASFETTGRSLERLGDLRVQAEQAVADVAVVVEHSDQIELMLEVIDDVSVRTNLLAINAAIEAAHAGEQGRGFAVVASEIKSLADSTRNSTKTIAQLVRNVRASVASAQLATARSAEETAIVTADSSRVRDDLSEVKQLVLGATSQIAAIAAAVDEQSTTLHAVSENIAALSRHGEEAAAHAARARNLVLGEINTEIFRLAGGFALGTLFDRMRRYADAFATDVEAVLEAAVARGKPTLRALFDTDYVELTGPLVQTLARLFDVSRVGPVGFDPPKYRTSGDQLLDDALAPVCDRYAECDPAIAFASIADINSFSFMVPQSLRADITGDRARDLGGNRVKRIFDDPVGLRAARVGLAGGLDVPPRSPRAAFLDRGIALARPDGPRPFALQTYARDTGTILNDLAVPIWVCAERFGCVRIGYQATEV
jgi:methyl-accepting chemotaxis protein